MNEMIKPSLHVNGNILAEQVCSDFKNGGGIICYVSSECVDLSKTIVINGDLHVQSLTLRGQYITCSGEFSCYSSSEVDAPCR